MVRAVVLAVLVVRIGLSRCAEGAQEIIESIVSERTSRDEKPHAVTTRTWANTHSIKPLAPLPVQQGDEHGHSLLDVCTRLDLGKE